MNHDVLQTAVYAPAEESYETEIAPVRRNLRLLTRHLTTVYPTRSDEIKAVDDVSLSLEENQIVGIVGESGCGKSTLALSILGLLRYPACITDGQVLLGDSDLMAMDKTGWQKLRGKKISFIPQNAMNVLNPVITIKKQMMEAIQVHRKMSRKEAEKEAYALLEMVSLPDTYANSYSHELSGGMRQRVVIATALANKPDVVIADEPTTGLDVIIQHGIVQLLVDLQKQCGISVIFITHDLPLVSSFADRLVVMYRGKLVEQGSVLRLYDRPDHFHTRALFENFPRLRERKHWVRECANNGHPLLSISGISKTFHARYGLGLRPKVSVKAVDDISLDIRKGEVVGLIGGSGSGKTTIARLVMGLIKPDAGEIVFDGEHLESMRAQKRKELLKGIHLVFQDPYQSMRNKMRVRDVVAEPMKIHGIKDPDEIEETIAAALEDVNLTPARLYMQRFPSELSGGQRQRVAFARALVTSPKLIIADEPTSMLDVSQRMGLLELMESLRQKHDVAFLFITHDLALAKHFCDRLIVLNKGRIVEEGQAEYIIDNPAHPYTRALLEAVKEPDFLTLAKN